MLYSCGVCIALTRAGMCGVRNIHPYFISFLRINLGAVNMIFEYNRTITTVHMMHSWYNLSAAFAIDI